MYNNKKILLWISIILFIFAVFVFFTEAVYFGVFIMLLGGIFLFFSYREYSAEIKTKAKKEMINESFNRSVAAFEDKISYESVNRARKDVFEYIAILSEEEYKEKKNLLPYSQMCIATTTSDLNNLTFAILYYHYADFTSMIKELKETFKITGNINWGKLKRSMFYFLTKEHDVNTLDLKDEKNVQFIKYICDIIESSIERIRIEPKCPTHSRVPTPTISETEKLVLSRELLVAYCLDTIFKENENSDEIDESTKTERENLTSKKALIESSIREYIMDKEEKYGSDFLTEKPDDENNQNHIFDLISKYSFCVALYYTMDFDSYTVFSKKQVCSAIQEVLDTPTAFELSESEFKSEILKRLN